MKKIAAWRKKSTDDPREESITEDPEEEPVSEDSKRTLEDLISVKPKENLISEDLWYDRSISSKVEKF